MVFAEASGQLTTSRGGGRTSAVVSSVTRVVRVAALLAIAPLLPIALILITAGCGPPT